MMNEGKNTMIKIEKIAQYIMSETMLLWIVQRVTGNKKEMNSNRIRAIIIEKVNENSYIVKTPNDKLRKVNITQIYK